MLRLGSMNPISRVWGHESIAESYKLIILFSCKIIIYGGFFLLQSLQDRMAESETESYRVREYAVGKSETALLEMVVGKQRAESPESKGRSRLWQTGTALH